jgi:hypothetical protein
MLLPPPGGRSTLELGFDPHSPENVVVEDITNGF